MGRELTPDGQHRVFGARAIERHCQQAKIPEVDRPQTSIDDQPHANSREIQRRLRQQERQAKKGK